MHHNLVVALLNDLFGIQARGGCSCAGPYGHRLLREYRFDPRSGLWRHRHAPPPPPGLDPFAVAQAHQRVPDSALTAYLHQRRQILAAHPDPDPGGDGPASPVLPDPLERLRWFQLPDVCLTGRR